MTFQDVLELHTEGHRDMNRIDDRIQEIVTRSTIQTGTVHIFNIGSTGTVAMIEYEPGLIGDFPEMLDRLIPPSRSYGHELAWHDGNGHSHLQASLLGPEMTVPVTRGELNLGTWQQIIHLECDVKPRTRKLVVTVQGD